MYLIVLLISFQILSFYLGYMNRLGMYPWYGEILKSSLTPPGYIFAIVWPVLYCFLAIIGWRLHKFLPDKEYKGIRQIYWAQMILNWSWSLIFFNLHAINIAVLILFLLVIINGYILLKMSKTDYWCMLLTAPYLVWLCFALYLNLIIVILN